jgi:hypothetical protein
MSLSDDAAMRFRESSGSWTQSTNRGTAPASTTVDANSALCPAMYPSAHAALSLTPGSNSSKHITRASSAPESTTACANAGECFATARNTNAAACL